MCEMITAISPARGNAWQGQGRCRTRAVASSLPCTLAACVATAAAPRLFGGVLQQTRRENVPPMCIVAGLVIQVCMDL